MAVYYHKGKFPPKNLDWERLAKPIEEAINALARYDSFLGIIPDASILISPMLIQEAVTSSRIEGTRATMGDVLVYEAGGEFNPEKQDDVKEVINYRFALEKAESLLKELPISGRVLKEAHRLLLYGVRGQSKAPGEYRNDQNWIGTTYNIKDARYVPIAPELLEDAMAVWERYVNESEAPTLIKVSIAHAEFESIHPFRDGNGRIGRMIVPLMLHSEGVISHPCFYLSEFFEHRNNEYQDRLLAVSESDDWTGWCSFFLEAIKTQANENNAKAQKIFNLYQEMIAEVMENTKAKGANRAVDMFFRSAVFPSNMLIKDAGMSESAARRLLDYLKGNGRLVEIKPHSGRAPAILMFPRLIEITEGVSLT